MARLSFSWISRLRFLSAAVLLLVVSSGCAEVRDEPADAGPDPAGEDAVPPDLDAESPEDVGAEGEEPAEVPDAPPDEADPAGDTGGDEPAPEDAVEDLDAPADVASDPDIEPEPEPEYPWGDPVCGMPASIPDCTVLCFSPSVHTDSVVFPSLGTGRVMQLEIDIAGRYILGQQLEFNDLEVSITSPSGTKVTFWGRFIGGNSWESSYDFISPWQMPFWWDEPFSGTWTLEVKDHMFSGNATTMNSWCLTPHDPADHAAVDPGASLHACWTGSHGITDYCHGDSPDSCTTHPITAELQVTDLVKALATPTLTVDITHPSLGELEIKVKTSYGREITVWDESPGDLPASFALSDHSGKWMTGRWSLTVIDHDEGNTGTLNGWCLEAN